jgi:hypothetical protein
MRQAHFEARQYYLIPTDTCRLLLLHRNLHLRQRGHVMDEALGDDRKSQTAPTNDGCRCPFNSLDSAS